MRKDVENVIKEYKIKIFGYKKNIEKLENLLTETEEVLFLSPTNLEITNVNTHKKEVNPGVVALTTARFVFFQKIAFSEKVEIINLDEIKAIDCRGNGLTGSHIEIHTLVKTYDILITYKKQIMEKILNTFIEAKDAYVQQKTDKL